MPKKKETTTKTLKKTVKREAKKVPSLAVKERRLTAEGWRRRTK